MGSAITTLRRFFAFRRPVRVLMLGLDGAGKTTILYRLKLDECVTTIPTVGFNSEVIECGNLSLTIWDVRGTPRLWSSFLQDREALIFVVDSTDTERMWEVREELFKVLSDDRMNDCKVLVFANKQDRPNALSVDTVIEELNMKALKRREWHVQASNAKTGDGLAEGLEWLHKVLN